MNSAWREIHAAILTTNTWGAQMASGTKVYIIYIYFSTCMCTDSFTYSVELSRSKRIPMKTIS